MAAIKKFFEKKKMEVKFKLAGEGHRLNESPQHAASSSKASASQDTQTPRREVPSSEAKMAAHAALARFEKKDDDFSQKRSIAVIKAQARKELELEQQLQASKLDSAVEANRGPTEHCLAVDGVFFKCPLIGPDVLPKREIDAKIKLFLYEQLTEEPGLTACLIIHTLNKDKEQVQQGIETLYKYLDNITQNPSQEKYRRIRTGNRIYQEKVACLQGVDEFLHAAGFVRQQLPLSTEDPSLESFWVFEGMDEAELQTLAALRDALVAAEPLKAELDRNVQVLVPSQAAIRTHLPDDFFRITPEELKKEQQARSEQVERNLMLRTKAMREKDEQREQRKYKFTLVRVRFPDGTVLQGTFHVQEKVMAVRLFIQEHLDDPSSQFSLTTAGTVLDNQADGSTLLALRLVPTAVLYFNSVKGGSMEGRNFLRDDVLALIQTMN